MIVLIFGLPGTGKTSLARKLLEHVDAVHLNADDVRSDLSSDLGFSESDRIEQARRLGAIARLLSKQGKTVIVDFVNPTEKTRSAFGRADFSLFVDRVDSSRFEDTNSIWETPNAEYFDLKIPEGMTIKEESDLVIESAKLFDWKKPTTLMLGRYQPWHEGHQALKEEGHKRTDQVLIGVRNTYGTSEKDPLTYEEVKSRIDKDSGYLQQNTVVLRLPNITNIIYGRDVGYRIEHVELSADLQAISATQKRKELGI